MLKLYPWLLVIDPKGDFGGPKGLPGSELVSTPQAMARSRARLIHYRPPIQLQTEENWDRVYQWAFNRGNTFIYTDELLMIMDGYSVPDGFRSCACQGRSR